MAFNTLKKMGLLTSREALVALKASVQGRDKYFYENSKLSPRNAKTLSLPASSKMEKFDFIQKIEIFILNLVINQFRIIKMSTTFLILGFKVCD